MANRRTRCTRPRRSRGTRTGTRPSRVRRSSEGHPLTRMRQVSASPREQTSSRRCHEHRCRDRSPSERGRPRRCRRNKTANTARKCCRQEIPRSSPPPPIIVQVVAIEEQLVVECHCFPPFPYCDRYCKLYQKRRLRGRLVENRRLNYQSPVMPARFNDSTSLHMKAVASSCISSLVRCLSKAG